MDAAGCTQALRAAESIARQAGDLIRTRYAEPRRIGSKSAAVDLVTDTDRSADRLIVARLAEAFPAHAVVSEEGGVAPPRVSGGGPDVSWIVDPLDGTTNFAHGFPQFAVSIAAVVGLDVRDPLRLPPAPDAHLAVGVVYDPMRDELFSATAHGPATCNGTPISTTAETSLDACLFATGFPYDRRERADFYLSFWREMMLRCRDVRRAGAAALDLAWVACGRLDGFWEWNLHAWDIAAGALIVERAGGRASDFAGRRLLVDAQQTLATNGRVHQAAGKVLSAVLGRDEEPPGA